MSGLCLVRGIALAITMQRSTAMMTEYDQGPQSQSGPKRSFEALSGNQPEPDPKRRKLTTPSHIPETLTPGSSGFPVPPERKRKWKREEATVERGRPIKRMRFTTPPGPPTPGFSKFREPRKRKMKRKREGSTCNNGLARTKIPNGAGRYKRCCKHRVKWYMYTLMGIRNIDFR